MLGNKTVTSTRWLPIKIFHQPTWAPFVLEAGTTWTNFFSQNFCSWKPGLQWRIQAEEHRSLPSILAVQVTRQCNRTMPCIMKSYVFKTESLWGKGQPLPGQIKHMHLEKQLMKPGILRLWLPCWLVLFNCFLVDVPICFLRTSSSFPALIWFITCWDHTWELYSQGYITNPLFSKTTFPPVLSGWDSGKNNNNILNYSSHHKFIDGENTDSSKTGLLGSSCPRNPGFSYTHKQNY